MLELPRPEEQAYAESVLLMENTSSETSYWLVYENHRDYLSAPRAFSLIKLTTEYELHWSSVSEVDSDNEFGDESEHESLGVTQIDSAKQIWRIHLPNLYFECCGELEFKGIQYSNLGASDALMSFLQARG